MGFEEARSIRLLARTIDLSVSKNDPFRDELLTRGTLSRAM